MQQSIALSQMVFEDVSVAYFEWSAGQAAVTWYSILT